MALSVKMSELLTLLKSQMTKAGGALPFDAFMASALYTPGLGYYSRKASHFGALSTPNRPSDFITAPTLSPAFGHTVGRQVQAFLDAVQVAGGKRCITEFGAGTGQLMLQIAQHENEWINGHPGKSASERQILELSAPLRAAQQATLAGLDVEWANELPNTLSGVLLGNEVLDAMPVKLLQRTKGVWHERCVAWNDASGLIWHDAPTELRPPLDIAGEHDYTTEIHPQAEAFVTTLAERMQHAVLLLIDYGFGEREYYHPQRHMGTLMCHQNQRADTNPLASVGEKDITTHINFTGIAVAAQTAGLDVLGYTTQGRFLLNCGLLDHLTTATLPQRANAQKLVTEHEMGELFKVIALCTPDLTDSLTGTMGFLVGDRTHTL
jgi:SAM-dependent MidA family methyltransferase